MLQYYHAIRSPLITKHLFSKYIHMPVEGVNVVVPEAKEFEVLPVDVYHTQLLDIEFKMQKAWNSDNEEEILVFTFVIIQEGEFYGRRLWQYARPKLSKYKGGSNLYKVLVGLNEGVQLTDEQCATPEITCSDEALNAHIGKQVRLTVSQKAKQDKTLKNVIDSYLPAKDKLAEFDPDKVQKDAPEPAPVPAPAPAAGATDDIDFDA